MKHYDRLANACFGVARLFFIEEIAATV